MRSWSWLAAILTMSIVAIPDAAHAEGPATATPSVRTMTLAEAVAYARAHHPRLLGARERIAALKLDEEVPSAQWLPRVGAFAQLDGATTNNSTTTLLGVGTVDIPRVGATATRGAPYDFTPYPSTAVALGVRQQLYDFGRIAAERQAAALITEVERWRSVGTMLDVDVAVQQAYYAVLLAIAIEDASQSAFERAVTHRDQARANTASGMRPPIELTRAEADAARYEAGMMRARGALHVARSVFAVAVGVDDAELDASTAGSEIDKTPLGSLDDLLRRADALPVVREASARIEAQRGETKRLEVQTRPSLYATGAIDGRAGGAKPSSGPTPYGEGWLPVVPNYDVGVVLAWPILEPTWVRRADASRARENALAADREVAVRVQRAVITAAWQEADVAERTLGALQRGADAAKANYDQAENRLRVGLGTSTELADAQALRTEADIQLAIGRFQITRARVALARATGLTLGAAAGGEGRP